MRPRAAAILLLWVFLAAVPSLLAQVPADDGNVVVARISDNVRDRVVVFGKDATTASHLRYTYFPRTAGSDHIVVNPSFATTYFVKATGAAPASVEVSTAPNGGQEIASDAAGILFLLFEGLTVTPAPLAPQNIRLK